MAQLLQNIIKSWMRVETAKYKMEQTRKIQVNSLEQLCSMNREGLNYAKEKKQAILWQQFFIIVISIWICFYVYTERRKNKGQPSA